MTLKNNWYATLIASLLLLPNCAHKPSHLKKFPSMHKTEAYCESKDDLTLMVKAYQSDQCKNYFGVDLIKKGYIPLQIRVENQGPKSYIVRPSYINLPAVGPRQVAKLLHWDTSLFVCLMGYPALVFWWPATFWVAQGGYTMYKNNKQTNKLVRKSCLEAEAEEAKIRPFDVLNRFVFVRRNEFNPLFNFKIYNQDDKQLITFNVNCEKALLSYDS